MTILTALAAAFLAQIPEPAVTLEVSRPDEQLRALLGFFDGTRFDSPAAALVSWKLSAKGDLGKPAEAAIALLNPMMVSELASLDGARLVWDGSARWCLRLPKGGASIDALAVSLSLTDGGRDRPEGDWSVDRLGPPGELLCARHGVRAVIATDREALAAAIGGGWDLPGAALSGFAGKIDPGRALPAGIVRSVLLGWTCRSLAPELRLGRDSLMLDVRGLFRESPPGSGVLDPQWLEAIPAGDDLVAAAAAAPGLTAWADARGGWAIVFHRPNPITELAFRRLLPPSGAIAKSEGTRLIVASDEAARARAAKALAVPSAVVRAHWDDPSCQRFGLIWPARLTGMGGLSQSPPVVWTGWSGPEGTRDRFRWEGLAGMVRQASLAFDPPRP
jgi:hypothetical protein